MSFALTLPDGSKKEFDVAVSVADLASSISTSLAKNAVAGKVDGEIKPLDFQLDADHEVAILTNKDAEGLSVLRATVAFVLEALVKDKYPEIKLGQAEVSEDGFFIETDKEDQIKVTELPDLEKA
ncbi:MAG: TGS domain-containing protein, partial [Lactobacillus delbrueckii]